MDRYKQTAALYSQIATVYQDKFMDKQEYNDTYDAFCDQIRKANATILEIGCGPGNISRYLLTKRPDFKLTGIDFAPNMIALASSNNPTASFKVMDCREISTLKTTFDGIMCGFTMPYLTKEDCAKLIKDCADLLPAGGIFYFSLVEDVHEKSGYRNSSNSTPFYFYYHQADYLTQFLQENNFETVAIYRKNYPLPGGTSETHLIFIARKN